MLYALQAGQTPVLPPRIVGALFPFSEAHGSGRIYREDPAISKPSFVIAQIILLQALFYILTSGVPAVALLLLGADVSLDHYLNPTVAAPSDWRSAVALAALPGAAVCLGVVVAVTVERARKCADFVGTCVGLHGLVSLGLYGWPAAGWWWLLLGAFFVVATATGEWVCMQGELQDISV